MCTFVGLFIHININILISVSYFCVAYFNDIFFFFNNWNQANGAAAVIGQNQQRQTESADLKHINHLLATPYFGAVGGTLYRGMGEFRRELISPVVICPEPLHVSVVRTSWLELTELTLICETKSFRSLYKHSRWWDDASSEIVRAAAALMFSVHHFQV